MGESAGSGCIDFNPVIQRATKVFTLEVKEGMVRELSTEDKLSASTKEYLRKLNGIIPSTTP